MVTTNKSLVEPPFNNTSGTLPNGNPYTSWDSPVNYNMTTLDNALGSTTAISVTGVTTTQTFTLSQYQSLMIDFTGVLSNDVLYNVPAGVGGFWIISNSCTANHNVSIGYNVGTVVIPKGGQYLVFVDTTTSPYINLLQISGVAINAGNPNGVLAGNSTAPASIVWDTTNKWLWVCTTSGPPSTAVWASTATPYVAPTPHITVKTSGTTFTTNVNTKFTKVTVVGGGGTGGVGGVFLGGSGGGGGGAAIKIYTLAPSTAYTYAVAAAGGNSAFTDGVNPITGIGGANGAASATAGGAGGGASGGDINLAGNGGGAGGAGVSGSQGSGGSGGASALGSGGGAGGGVGAPGGAGQAFGGGGAGGGGAGSNAGGGGYQGVVIFEEWY